MVKDKEMLFTDSLDGKLFKLDLPDLESEKIFNEAVLPEDKRQTVSKFFGIIKKILALDISSLFRLADAGGEVQETIIISDLYWDVLCEAAGDEDYSHMQGAEFDEPDPLEMDPLLPKPVLAAKTVFRSNYHKLLEISVKTPDVAFRGYVIDTLDKSDQRISKELRDKVALAKKGSPPPFRWFRNTDDALREMEVLERQSGGQPLKKPAVKKAPPMEPVHHGAPISYKELLEPPKAAPAKAPLNFEELIKPIAIHYADPETAKQIGQLDRKQLARAVEVGKKAVKTQSPWSIFKKIFLGYLALQGIATGMSGLAALVIGYLAVTGIDYLRNQHKAGLPQAPRPIKSRRLH